ncbi:alpha/beta hydrolase [Embleya sp. NPDC020630]|uniref:alpha/beta hydrolase n=1 Tax=Embleya sp. NPDC020630 TaxID=3363979 RepID=UPI0037AB99EF
MDHEPQPGREPVVLEPLVRAFVDEHRRVTSTGTDGGRSTARPHDRLPGPHSKTSGITSDITSGTHAAVPDVEEARLAVPVAHDDRQVVRVLRPVDADEPLPVILYVPGPSRTRTDAPPQQAFERDLVLGADAAVVVLDPPHPHGERHPATVEGLHTIAAWLFEHGADVGLDPRRVAAVGVSTGANLVAGLTLATMRHGGPPLLQQVLICPTTDASASASTSWYAEFVDGYVPDPGLRDESTGSPLRAGVDELAGLPPALILVAEADVLRDEGEAYAARLRTAGVPVVSLRYHGTIHAFVALDALRDSHASRAARIQVVDTLHVALHTWR